MVVMRLTLALGPPCAALAANTASAVGWTSLPSNTAKMRWR